jgi:hypothetical protein
MGIVPEVTWKFTLARSLSDDKFYECNLEVCWQVSMALTANHLVSLLLGGLFYNCFEGRLTFTFSADESSTRVKSHPRLIWGKQKSIRFPGSQQRQVSII